jgi:peptidoglycan/xylan/chitin deacetylase (PgdA/CDA1 family)
MRFSLAFLTLATLTLAKPQWDNWNNWNNNNGWNNNNNWNQPQQWGGNNDWNNWNQQQNNNQWGGNNDWNNWNQPQQQQNDWNNWNQPQQQQNDWNNWNQPQQQQNDWNNWNQPQQQQNNDWNSWNQPQQQQNNDWNNGQAQAQAPAGGASNFSKGSGLQFYSQCKNPMDWAMTYDDGPTEFADAILDLLKENGIKATFFTVGRLYMDSSNPDWARIIKRMDAEGHIVGNHTYDHVDLTTISADQIVSQMKQQEDLIYQAIGKRPAFMRPPYGSGNGNQNVMNALQQAGYTAAITWNVDPQDYSNGGDSNYARQVINQAKGQPIITLNHLKYQGASKEGILALARAEIETMKANGYKSVSMEECLGISAYQ